MFINNLQPIKRKPIKAHNEAKLFSVMKATDLLNGEEVKQLLKKIKHWAAVPQPCYVELYQKLIEKFADFVQILPGQNNCLGGLLIESLQQACLGMQIYHEDATQEIDPLFAYAVFSAALLMPLPHIFYKTVIACNENGVSQTVWSPLAGSLIRLGISHYKIRDYGLGNPVTNPYLRVALAYRIMPRAGILWLNEEPEVAKLWWCALGGDEEGSGALGLILDKTKQLFANNDSNKEYLPIGLTITQPEDTAAGEAFFAWLREELVDNFNPQFVRIGNDGLAISEQAFHYFSKLYPRYPNWQIVAQQFKQLDCTLANEASNSELDNNVTNIDVNKDARQNQKFFNLNANKPELQDLSTSNFKESLVIEEKNLLRQLLSKTQMQKLLQEQQRKKLARRRIQRLLRLLKLKAAWRKRRLLIRV